MEYKLSSMVNPYYTFSSLLALTAIHFLYLLALTAIHFSYLLVLTAMANPLPSVCQLVYSVTYTNSSNVSQFSLIHTFQQHTKAINILSVSPDGRFLLSGCKLYLIHSARLCLTVFQPTTLWSSCGIWN